MTATTSEGGSPLRPLRKDAIGIAELAGVTIARIILGVLWLGEGIVKYRAGFGAADIVLVADGFAANSRAPQWFAPVAAVMDAVPQLFGIGIPLLELGLGLALIAGLFSRLAAVGSALTLVLYWSTDQLTWQYPLMAALSTAVIALPLAGELGADGWRRRRRSWSGRLPGAGRPTG